ncbi:flagellar assembly protein FliW [Bacillus sp. DJP31]|uniref:flagellar assembly protein FliW n=1 Tax=Bacillus sp. DJP31 TaxID=3409789 RepID=UPI003BB78ED7
MNYETKYHGNIEVNETEIVVFENGLPGFEENKKFILLPLDTESPFLILQSLEERDLGFVVIEPFLTFPNYEFDLSESIVEKLQLEDKNDSIVFNILSIKEPFEQTTVNLQAPVIVNKNKRLGRQVILNDYKYNSRHLLNEYSSLREER